jgi:crotonobetainyl-CoA:carnitine CoA-transferase CaiB-like acyl-CoA transferase
MASEKAELQGLRVIGLKNFIAALFCATRMAEFGAEIIEVEDPGIGEAGRHRGKVVDGASLNFAFLARDKKRISSPG